MLKLALRSVLAHRLRFVLCTVAVVLGVSFAGGAMIFTDTLSAALRQNFAGSTADITVTPDSPVTNPGRPPTLTSDLANRLAAVPGVAGTDPQVLVSEVQILGKTGKPTETYNLPTYAAGWPHDDRTRPFRIIEGKPPWGQTQLGLDKATAEREGYELGQQVRVVTPARTVTGTLTAITTPVLAGAAAGAPLASFDSASAQLLLLGQPGWTSIGIAVAPDQDHAKVAEAVNKVAGPGVKVRTADQVAAEGENALDQTFGGFSAALLMFAGLALFVGAFLIVNTFAMTVAQRSRELALLRAIGASRAQVTRTVLGEALVIGAIGATIGLGIGIGVAAGIQAAYQQLNLAIPRTGLQIRTGTIISCYLIGIGVTLAAAYPAARRAGKLPPVAALRDDVTLPQRSLLVRMLCGGFVLLMAAVLYLVAFTADGMAGAILLGLGGAIMVIAVVLFSPLISRYAVRALMAPFGRRAPVTLGRRNAERNPRRTSATASALMISLALVSGLVVIASSAKASIDRGIADELGTSDLIVSTSEGPGAFSSQVGDRIGATPGVAAVHRVRGLAGQVNKTPVQVRGVSDGTLAGAITVKLDSGSLDGLKTGGVLVPRPLANELDLETGKPFQLTTTTGQYRLVVAGVLAPTQQLDAIVVSLPKFAELGGPPTDSTLYVDLADGADRGQAAQTILGKLTDYPSVQVRDQQEYAKSQRGPVDTALVAVAMLLALAVLIAILGIVNTLALGVIERTREIGLLRAIGMDRPQLRRMLRVESIAISLLGAVLGLLLGVGHGAAIQSVLREDGLAVLDIPVLELLITLLVAAGVGVLAAVWPARRAARLDVLRAIATE